MKFFIYRPILSCVISIITMLCGLVALLNLPISQFPNISPPSISVRTSFPGANAETSARVVGAQIEGMLNGVPNLLYMTSNASTGKISINLTFEVGTDLNIAINDVLNRLYAAKDLLPAVVQQLGITARKSSPDNLMMIAFYSDPYRDPTWISSYLQRTVANDLQLIPTIGQVSVFGAGRFVITAWLNPNKMQRYGIGVSDIKAAINEQNQEYVVGRINETPGDSNKQLTLNIIGQKMYSTADELANVILRNNDNQTVRLKDIARISMSSNDFTTASYANFRDIQGNFKRYQIVTMAISLLPGANELSAKKQILAKLNQDSQHFPRGLNYRITQDNSRFIAASIDNVVTTVIIAFILVAVILFLFLQDWRASVVAICSIPVSILGTMACLYVCGFSLNTLSLFAMILAIGIVVDDAIVIVENVGRLRGEYPNLSLPRVIELALNEVFGAIVAIVLVLSVVFIPVLMLKGLSGIMYRQFAATIACAVIISGINALTFIPALCAILLTKSADTPALAFFGWFNQQFMRLNNSYVHIAQRMIIIKKTAILMWLVIILSTIGLYKIISVGFIPNEDQGLLFASLNLPTSYTLEETQKQATALISRLTKNPNIDSVVSVSGVDFLDSGSSKSYASSLIVILKDWSERRGNHHSANSIIKEIETLSRSFHGMTSHAYNQPPIRGLSTTGGVEFYVEDRVVGNPEKLEAICNQLIKRLRTHHEIADAYQTLNTHSLQITIQPDVDRAKYYGVNLQNYYNVLQATYTNTPVNFAYIMQDQSWVYLQADAPYRASINNLDNVYVKSANNSMVPLAAISQVTTGTAAKVIQHFNGYLASRIIVKPAAKYSMGDVMNIISAEAASLPKGYYYDWYGTSYQQQQSQSNSLWAFVFSLTMIYLVLAALYEKWRLPLVVLVGVPAALFGAAIILLLSGKEHDLYFQISLIALLGLSAKNIILLVEFALQWMKKGHLAGESAIHALRVRFRPIIMTSTTFIAGTIPLVFADGAGANAQHSVGFGIIGGMLGSVMIATLFTPVFFCIIMGHSRKEQ